MIKKTGTSKYTQTNENTPTNTWGLLLLTIPQRLICTLAVATLFIASLNFAVADESDTNKPAPNNNAEKIGPAVSNAIQANEAFFKSKVAPILQKHCVGCHNADVTKGDLAMHTAQTLAKGDVITPGKPDESWLVDMIIGPKPEMPPKDDPLTNDQVNTIKKWIKDGANFPKELVLEELPKADLDWWSLKPITKPELPKLDAYAQNWARNPVDHFIYRKLKEKNLTPSKEADKRTLIRRLYFDLIGLPPTPEQIEQFVNNKDPQAYEKLVDELLASKHYGERWARHWLDVARYGDTHGYDKDKLRMNAWPYRDYVIRAFNNDMPYTKFVKQQVAGDVLEPYSDEGVIATGFLAAGPWDFIAHVEVGEGKLDGRIAKHMDRDEMLAATFNVFMSTTVQCAQCHHHKFDPVKMEDYYRLHAVFAAVDRADRPIGIAPELYEKRQQLNATLAKAKGELNNLNKQYNALIAKETKGLDAEIAIIRSQAKSVLRPEFGYHSQIVAKYDTPKWVQIDLGKVEPIHKVVLNPCFDDFNNIGAGFGFPVRYRVEASNDPQFKTGIHVVTDQTKNDVPNPKTMPMTYTTKPIEARYIRVTATKLAERQNDFIFALAELQAYDDEGNNLAHGKPVTALDSIEAPIRWRKANLTDGIYFREVADEKLNQRLTTLTDERKAIEARYTNTPVAKQVAAKQAEINDIEKQLKAIPQPKQRVYAIATEFNRAGNFAPTNGKPREIRLLKRGNMKTPGDIMQPGTVALWKGVSPKFNLPDNADEGDRRIALAEYLVDPDNPLTWRSIVNRLWLYHMGQGIAGTPNDFGRMGLKPSHPELLDWLAIKFRDGGQSMKDIHRLIVNSATYRQVSTTREDMATVDAGNQYYWRMNRRKMEAEVIRDSILAVSGKLNLEMYGPSFQDFVIEKPQHSPHFQFHLHDPNDPKAHRRSIYRFIPRSKTQPFLTTLDCADPSQVVARRDDTTTPLQALTLLNNKLVVAMSRQFADRLKREHPDNLKQQLKRGMLLVTGRQPADEEVNALEQYTNEFGLENTCRIMLNLSEFIYID